MDLDYVFQIDEINLQKEYDALNRKIFGGQLGTYPMKWNSSKRAWGLTRMRTRRTGGNLEVWVTSVEISKLTEITYGEFLSTLAHEMIHVWVAENVPEDAIRDAHGFHFQKWMSKLNGMGLGYTITKTDAIPKNVIFRDQGKRKTLDVLVFTGKYNGFVIPQHTAKYLDELAPNFPMGTALTLYRVEDDYLQMAVPKVRKARPLRLYRSTSDLRDRWEKGTVIGTVMPNAITGTIKVTGTDPVLNGMRRMEEVMRREKKYTDQELLDQLLG